MSILGSLFAVIKQIVKSIINIIVTIFKKFWWVILIIAAIYFFGPMFIVYLQSVGAPAWLITASTYIVTAVTSGVTWVGALFASGWSSLVTSAAGWSLKTWATVALGTGMLLAPEQTGDLLGEVGGAIGDVGSGVIGGILGSGLGGWLLLGVGGYFLYQMVTKPDNENTDPPPVASYEKGSSRNALS